MLIGKSCLLEARAFDTLVPFPPLNERIPIFQEHASIRHPLPIPRVKTHDRRNFLFGGRENYYRFESLKIFRKQVCGKRR